MFNEYYIGKSANDISVGQKSLPFSKVVITDSSGKEYSAGTDTGKTLALEMPWGNQAIANSILQKFSGLTYQSYTADGAHVPAEADLGDILYSEVVKGGIFSKRTNFSPFMVSSVSAPQNDEENDEYPYLSKIERESRRTAGAIGGLSGRISAAEEEIDGIQEDYQELVATVEGVQAGMTAYVLNDTFENYKTATAQVFTSLENADAELTLTVEQNKAEIDGKLQSVETAQSQLATKVDDVETSLSQKAEKTKVLELDGRVEVIESAQTSLSSRVDDAEAAIDIKADKATVVELDGRVTEAEEAQTALTTRVSGAETALEMQSQSIDGLEAASAQLSARTDLAEASIQLQAGEIDGVQQSVISIQADVTKLKGVVTAGPTSAILVDNLTVKGSTMDFNSGLHELGVSTNGGLICNGKTYTPTEITSTTGPVLVLGHA